MDDPTLTPEAMALFTELGVKAEESISRLPESSQPIWYRQQRVKLPIPQGELLPAEERLQNVLKAIEDRMRREKAEWDQMQKDLDNGWPLQPEDFSKQWNFIQGLDIAWSLAQTEILRRTDSP